MSILRPYVNWLRCLEGLKPGQPGSDITKQHKHDGTFALCPLFDVDHMAVEGHPDAEGIRKRIVQTVDNDILALRDCKRFVMPEDFNPYRYDQPDNLSIERLYVRNPHLPFKRMYLQMHHDSIFENDQRHDTHVIQDTQLEENSFTDTDHFIEGHSHVRFWTFMIEQNELGWGVRIGAEREFQRSKQHNLKITFDFVPAAMAYGMGEVGRNQLGYGAYEGFVHKHPSEEMAGFYMTMMFVIGQAIDLINHYPVEIKVSQGLRHIGLKTKIKKFQKIEHSIIHLNRAYYEQVAVEKDERDKIRHREHDVRGHWRTLRNGRMVWVKSHRRGDPALGTMDSEYDV